MFKKDEDNTKDLSKQTAYENSCIVARKNNKPIPQTRRGRVDNIMALDEMQEIQNKWMREPFYLEFVENWCNYDIC